MSKGCSWKIILSGFILLACLVFGTVYAGADSRDTVGSNIYIENICVSGMTEEEVTQVMQDKLSQYADSQIIIGVNGKSTMILAGEMGLTQTNPGIVKQIMKMGNKGNIWQRYNMEQYLNKNDAIVFELNMSVSEEAVRALVEERCVPLNIARQDMQLYFGEDGQLYPTEKVDGKYVDVDQTVAAICDYMNNGWHGGYGEINAVITTDKAAGDKETYSQVHDVLGQGVTAFSTAEDQTARNTNIAVAVSRINGTIVYPGEEFSALAHMEPFLPDVGYVGAPSYEMGSVIDTYGGGACQVSTTLYRAVLESELLVTERCAHSMIVGYCEPSMDAAVAEGIKDLKFVNDTDAPIFIEGSVGNGMLEFTIYGHETRDPARAIAFQSEIIKETEIEVEFVLDPDLPFGKIEESQGHKGQIAQSYKLVYMNGELVERSELNWSEYKASNQTYSIGTNGASNSQIARLAEAAENYDMGTIYGIIEGN